MRLFINNREIELNSKTKIAQTIQVNDLADIRTRQTNHTNRFKVPKTANNKQVFNYLGVAGNTSDTPYKLNSVYLLSESGEVLINNGFATVKSTTNTYNINIYYGSLDLFRAMGGENLSDLDLTDLTHEKTTANISATFVPNTLNYRYMVADYGGETEHTSGTFFGRPQLLSEYMMPSVNVKYLWDRIFDRHGFTYEGSVFLLEDFGNIWMSYPKGLLSTIPDEEVYNSDDINFTPNPILNPKESIYLEQVTNSSNSLVSIFDNKHFKVADSGDYRVEITGNVTVTGVNGQGNTVTILSDIWICKNEENTPNSDNANLLQYFGGVDFNGDIFQSGNTVEINAQANESLCIVFKVQNGSIVDNMTDIQIVSDVELTITKVASPEIIDFSEALSNYKQLEFVREIMVRYGLTPYKQDNSNHYKFLTMDELLQTTNVVDWSAGNNKFSELKSESYKFGTYAQVNYFRHKYNDDNDSYFDRSIDINNENLKNEKTVHNSSIYVPSRLTTSVLGKQVNTYRMWDRSVDNNGDVSFDSLSERFYFMRSKEETFSTPFALVKEKDSLLDVVNVYSAPYASFAFLSYEYSISEYYKVLRGILDDVKIIKANIFLTEQDIATINLIGVYYIKELSNYFILNKIKNFIKKGKTEVELVKVDYTNLTVQDNTPIIISVRVVHVDQFTNTIIVSYDNTRFQEANIDYILNTDAPVTVPNNGTITFSVPVNNPQINNEFYLNSPTLFSEVINFLS